MKKNLLLPTLLLSSCFLGSPAQAQIDLFFRPDLILEYDFNGNPLGTTQLAERSQPLIPNYFAVSGDDVYVVGTMPGGGGGAFELDGSVINNNLFPGAPALYNIVVSGGNLFVAEESTSGNFSIGKYGIDGSRINPGFIPLPDVQTEDLIVSGNDLFVAEANGTIGEYGLDGSTVSTALLSGFSLPTAIAISGSDIFVADYNKGTIGEYGLDGSTIDASLVTGLDNPGSLYIYNGDIYVSNMGNGTIGEYGLDGTPVNASLIQVPGSPDGGNAILGLYVVPEPTTLALAVPGAIGLWIAFRRKKQRAGR